MNGLVFGDKRAWPTGTPVWVRGEDGRLVSTTTSGAPTRVRRVNGPWLGWVVQLRCDGHFYDLDRVNFRGGVDVAH